MKEYVGCKVKKTGKKSLIIYQDDLINKIEKNFGELTNIAAPRGITEDSFKLTLDKFKNQAFKDFAARHQVNYLRQNLRKPVGG